MEVGGLVNQCFYLFSNVMIKLTTYLVFKANSLTRPKGRLPSPLLASKWIHLIDPPFKHYPTKLNIIFRKEEEKIKLSTCDIIDLMPLGSWCKTLPLRQNASLRLFLAEYQFLFQVSEIVEDSFLSKLNLR